MSEGAGSGGSGQAAGAEGGAGGAGGAGAGGQGAGGAAPWYGAIEDADLKTWADNKNFKGPTEALKSYQNLEKMLGAEKAGRTVVLPSDDDPTKWNEVFGKLGRPETADKYGIETPEGGDPTLVKWFKDTAHKHGLSEKQAKSLFADYNEMIGGRLKEMDEQSASGLAASQEALKKEWGAAYDEKLSQAKAAAQQFGFKPEEITAIEAVVGFDGIMKRFADIGAKLGEGKFVGGESRGGNAFGNMTPAQAEATIGELRGDKDFQARLIGGDKHAQERWDKLHRDAYGKR